MEEKIKKTYTVLSGGKQISSGEYIIASGHFNSITRDRFVAELYKNGIVWDGKDISFNKLLNKEIASGSNGASQNGFHTAETSSSGVSATPASDASVGIDIQEISEMPPSADYWEDTFYRMKFKPEEIAYCLKKENPVQSFAGIYACKEALIKCDNNLQWESIMLSFNQMGKPLFNGYQVSVSHSGNFAVAVAVRYPQISKEKDMVTLGTAEKTQSVTPLVTEAAKPKPPRYYPLAFALMLGIIAYFIYRDFILN